MENIIDQAHALVAEMTDDERLSFMREVQKNYPEDFKELKESNDNGMDWFDSYGEVDDFIFKELDKIGKEFPTPDKDRPEINTIEAIKILST